MTTPGADRPDDDGDRRVAVITGGAGGVGLALARRLGRDLRLVLADLDASRLESAGAELRADGADVTTALCDVTDVAAVRALAGVAAAKGPLGVLAHTAGLSPSMADARRILEVNLVGTALVLDAFGPLMGPGAVGVCVASISGHRDGLPQYDHLLRDPAAPGFLDAVGRAVALDRPGVGYALSKRGVVVECARRARAWGARGARLVSVSPGLIDTPMGRLEEGAGAKWLASVSAVARAASSDEVASAIAYLASSEASFISGVDLKVDGGAIAGFAHHADDERRAQWNDPWHGVDPWQRSAGQNNHAFGRYSA